MPWFRWQGADLLLEAKIQPDASRSEFAGMHGEHLKIRIHAPAVDGKANTELVAFLAQAFATSKSQIHIERGESGRIKSLRVCIPRQLPDALLTLGLSPGPTS